MLIEILVSADFEKRLDNQWEVEREIHADRWKWTWGELSTDCGKGWKSPEEYAALEAKCGKLRALANKLSGFVPCSMGTRDLLDEIHELLHQ